MHYTIDRKPDAMGDRCVSHNGTIFAIIGKTADGWHISWILRGESQTAKTMREVHRIIAGQYTTWF